MFQLLVILFSVFHATEAQCATAQTLYRCYISYLGKYGVVPDEGYLPPVDFLMSQMKSHGLPVLCKDFDELTGCLGPASTYCVNFDTFYSFGNGQYPQNEAVAYLQNHAFFEFACGSGKELFMRNLECLQRSFEQIPLTNRMEQCGQSSLRLNQDICPSTLAVTDCIRLQIQKACGPPAGAAACGAAANIERRLDFLDAACLTEMDARCSSCGLKVLTAVVLLFIHIILFS